MGKRIDILIKGGAIVDGYGSEPFEGNVGIAGDKIAFILEQYGIKRSDVCG